VSGGSACSSGVSSVSHVIKTIHGDTAHNIVPIRFSFSKINTKEELDVVVQKLKELSK
jgi:cysteine desulfurase